MKRIRASYLQFALCIAILFLAFYASAERGSVDAQQPTVGETSIEPLRASIGNFFENISDASKSPREAVDNFVANSAMAQNERAKVKIVDGLKSIEPSFGGYSSYEPIGFKAVGADLVVFRYLYKCENYPIVWYFTYYRSRPKNADPATSEWKLIGFRFDTNLDAALLDATF